MASLLQELEELRLSASVEQNRRYQADDRVRGAEEERKLMGDQLKNVLEDRAVAEEETRVEQEWASDLAKELSALQG